MAPKDAKVVWEYKDFIIIKINKMISILIMWLAILICSGKENWFVLFSVMVETSP